MSPMERWRFDHIGLVTSEPKTGERWVEATAGLAGRVREAIENHTVLLEPFDVGNGFATVAFVEYGGTVIEFMQYANPAEEEWF